MTPRVRLVLLATTAVALATGCTTTRTCDLPTGRWQGEGWYTEAHWEGSGDPSPISRFERRTHVTTLEVRPEQVDGKDGLRLTIQSIHGPRSDSKGDRNHIVVQLLPGPEAVGQPARLYELVRWGYSDTAKTPKLDLDPDVRWGPVAVRDADTLVLYLPYGENFVDVFRFRGAELVKDGSFVQKAGPVVHWHERLRRVAE